MCYSKRIILEQQRFNHAACTGLLENARHKNYLIIKINSTKNARESLKTTRNGSPTSVQALNGNHNYQKNVSRVARVL